MTATTDIRLAGRVALAWLVALLSWVPLLRHLTDRPLSTTWLTVSIVAAIGVTLMALLTTWQALDANRQRQSGQDR